MFDKKKYMKEYIKKYYEKNREKILKYRKEYRKNNKEKINEKQRNRYKPIKEKNMKKKYQMVWLEKIEKEFIKNIKDWRFVDSYKIISHNDNLVTIKCWKYLPYKKRKTLVKYLIEENKFLPRPFAIFKDKKQVWFG